MDKREATTTSNKNKTKQKTNLPYATLPKDIPTTHLKKKTHRESNHATQKNSCHPSQKRKRTKKTVPPPPRPKASSQRNVPNHCLGGGGQEVWIQKPKSVRGLLISQALTRLEGAISNPHQPHVIFMTSLVTSQTQANQKESQFTSRTRESNL